MIQAVDDYLDKVNHLDLSGRPDDFAAAYRTYLASWHTFAESLAGIGDTAEAAGAIDRHWIDRHWKDVLAVARKYRAVE
jgi:hypothetical protein